MHLLDKIIEAGQKGGWLLALIVAMAAVALVYAKLPEVAGLPLPAENKIVAATGDGLYDVEPFCSDPLTAVWASPAPDGEITFELTRARDGRQEAVIWSAHGPGAERWWFEGTEQRKGPALVNGKAEDCIRDKAKPR